MRRLSAIAEVLVQTKLMSNFLINIFSKIQLYNVIDSTVFYFILVFRCTNLWCRININITPVGV